MDDYQSWNDFVETIFWTMKADEQIVVVSVMIVQRDSSQREFWFHFPRLRVHSSVESSILKTIELLRSWIIAIRR